MTLPSKRCLTPFPHILVAEDNLVNQKVATRMLEKLGYRVDVAVNGLEVLEALSRVPYSAVLMDCHMPEMDGFETTRMIRERETTTRIPIIAMTANAIQGDRERCLEAGMDDYISKPVKTETLAKVLARWLPPAEEPSSSRLNVSSSSLKREGLCVKREAQPSLTNDVSRTTNDATPLDPTVLADLSALGGDQNPQFLTSLFDHFLEETPSRLTALRAAAEQGDGPALERTAHTLKSTCGNLGARPMAGICMALEEQGRNGRFEEVAPLLDDLENEFDRVRRALPDTVARCR